ncbi:MAG TPA: gliding motility-associated C-terminal domain-containing protein [Chitinophagales bacterium]|nr:gliding motility-associated C-terminal domain-containing protein [Chitinophagales bacterium]
MGDFKRIYVLVCLLWLCSHVTAQTNIGGVVNKYAAVNSINFCGNVIQVSTTNGFFVGQKVMLIQMKGAEIDNLNSFSFGNILNYKGCGNYEINEIELISGTSIIFKYALMRDYQPEGLQLVSLEEYTDAVVTSPLTAPAWDGSTGGVVLLKANTLTLNDSITVKGKGFRGAVKQNDGASQACFNNGIGGATDYYCSSIVCGAPKGEGIGFFAGNNYGRGKNGNGGGGGNDHNTGGGGGGNYGIGGGGGIRSNVSNFSCPGPGPGVGGGGLYYSNTPNRVFMGGGGGAGDGNNNELTSGANGGGIVIIMANTLVGNNRKINASGNRVDTMARSDGAGGGGAGGAVLLFVDNYTGNVQVNVAGGNGGILDNGGSMSFCMGPGGGGGGGALWVKDAAVSPNITLIDTGGKNGMNVFGLGPPACPYLTTNGASAGDNGGSLTGLQIPIDTIPFVRLEATACCDTQVCPGQTVRLSVTDTATFPPSVQWSSGETTDVVTPQVFTTTDFTVTVRDWRNCIFQDVLTVTVQNSIPNLTLCCDTDVCPGGYAFFEVKVTPPGALTYLWSTGETDNAILKQVYAPDIYTVTVTDANGCTAAKSGIVGIRNTPPPLTVCCDTIVCEGYPVTMSATSTVQVTYAWNTGQNTSVVTLPVVTNTTFEVTVTDANGCQAIQSAQASTTSIQTSITAVPDTSILFGQSVQLTAAGDTSYSYVWSPQAGLNNGNIYNPAATPDQSTTYCVTVTSNLDCTASACYNIELVQPDVKVPDAFSPNADGTSDVFTLFPLKFAEIVDVKVYNRWGEVVYNVNSNIPWDGTYKGKPQPTGAYVVQVNYGSSLNPGKVNTITKGFMLIR